MLRPVRTPCLHTIFTHFKDTVPFKDATESRSVVCCAFFVTDASVFREITAVGEAVAGPRKDVRKAAERLISR